MELDEGRLQIVELRLHAHGLLGVDLARRAEEGDVLALDLVEQRERRPQVAVELIDIGGAAHREQFGVEPRLQLAIRELVLLASVVEALAVRRVELGDRREVAVEDFARAFEARAEVERLLVELDPLAADGEAEARAQLARLVAPHRHEGLGLEGERGGEVVLVERGEMREAGAQPLEAL